MMRKQSFTGSEINQGASQIGDSRRNTLIYILGLAPFVVRT